MFSDGESTAPFLSFEEVSGEFVGMILLDSNISSS